MAQGIGRISLLFVAGSLTAGLAIAACSGSEPAPVEPLGGAPRADGAECGVATDCAGAVCLTGADFPGGMCTTLGCETEGCAGGGLCVSDPATGIGKCVAACITDGDCRDGYACRDFRGVVACHPALATAPFDAVPLAAGAVSCIGAASGETSIAFEVPADAASYSVVAFGQDGGSVRPLRLDAPSGSIDLTQGPNRFQAVSAAILGFAAPLVVPALPALSNQLEPGPHSVVVAAETRNLCVYLVSQADGERILDLSIYLASVPNLDAASAPDDPAVARMLDTLRQIYAPAGIVIGSVNFIDVEEPQFAVIESRAAIGELTSLSRPVAGDLESKLSLNVFLVQALDLPEAGVVGISQGIPGPPGLHGTAASGVVFTAELLAMGSNADPLLGAEFTGIVLAHEIGHYLGLFHTTENMSAAFDPLDDTPQCETGFPDDCPDRTNLMFPLAGFEARSLTPDQAFVLQANPLTRP
ncbi:MAG: hypothetical protein AAGF12_23220 [Myxococcota bacterium]